MNIVYTSSDRRGFVTDAGAPIELRDTTSGVACVLPRYGVWRPNDRGKFEVVHVTDYLSEAIAVCDGTEVR